MAHQCPGFGDYEGKCESFGGHKGRPGLPKNNVWCVRCDTLRIAHLDKRFKELQDFLERNK
jgi:hypothetical protein